MSVHPLDNARLRVTQRFSFYVAGAYAFPVGGSLGYYVARAYCPT